MVRYISLVSQTALLFITLQFRKSFSFRRKSSDSNRRRSGFQQTASHVRNPSQNRSEVSVPIEEESAGLTQSLPDPAVLRASASASESQKSSSPSRKNPEVDPGPLGLNVIYTPENGHKADIVFVHGLGGTSRMTWSKYKDPELFWPLTFLPLEPDVCLARILTFGYNAHFRKAGNVSTSVLDFAKDLLFDLKYARDEQKEDLNMGNVSIAGASLPRTYLTLRRGATNICCT